jgi:hypothetical protein
MSAPCVATGCDRFAVAKGLCARCYKRKAANGAPILKPRPSTLERLLRYSRAQPSGCRVWTTYIGENGSTIYLGSFRSEEDAARAYDEAATERYGAFALTNVALGLL